MHNAQPLTKTLSGLALEYRIVQLYSRDAGKRDAKLSFDVGQGTQDLGFRSEINLLFDCKPARKLTLRCSTKMGSRPPPVLKFATSLAAFIRHSLSGLHRTFIFILKSIMPTANT